MTTPEKRREEEGYIPPGDPGTMAAMERFMALPPEERAARRDEGLAIRDAYMEGYGTPPPEDVTFSRANGTRWSVEQPEGAKPAGMADLRRMEDAPPPAPAQDWGDVRSGGASMASAQELDEAGMLGMGPAPRPSVATPTPPAAPASATAVPRPTAPRRPGVDVSQVGQADAGHTFERLADAGKPMPTVGAGINPEVLAYMEKRAAPVDGLQAAQDAERERRMALAIGRAGAMASEAISGAKYDRDAYGDLEGAAGSPVRDYVLRKQQREVEARTAREAAMRDPNSPESIRQRAALKAVLPGVSDEVLAGVTAENAGELFNTLKFGTSEATRKAEAEKEAARYNAERQYRQGRDTVEDSFKRAQLGASAEERRLRREELAEQRAYARGQAADKIERDTAEHLGKQQTDFAKQYTDSGAPGFYAKYDEVKAILDANPKDLPGFGPLEGRLPDATTSAAGVKLRQSIGQMLAEYRKGITGAGMSDTERSEFERITGLLESGTEERVRLGVEGLKEAMDKRAQALAAGYRPEVVRAYAARAPSFPGAALQAASSAPMQPGKPDVDLNAPQVLVGADGKRWKSNGDGTYSPEG